jgi:hypothetical protein
MGLKPVAAPVQYLREPSLSNCCAVHVKSAGAGHLAGLVGIAEAWFNVGINPMPNRTTPSFSFFYLSVSYNRN